MDDLIIIYKKYICDRFQDLINANIKIEDLDNNHLCKIFEYYSCIKLSQEYNQIFYEYYEDGVKPTKIMKSNNEE